MKAPLFAILTALLSLTLSLVAGEIILRMTWTPWSTLSTPQWEQHPVYGIGLRPGISGRHVNPEFDYPFSHTRQGLRGQRLISAEKTAAQPTRVLVLGDSFTYGVGSANDETFVARIDAQLANVEIINTGVGGYSQRNQLAVLDQFGPVLDPDLIVLFFFWNDIEENFKKPAPAWRRAADGSPLREDIRPDPDFDPLALRDVAGTSPASDRSLLRRSYVYLLFKEGLRGFRKRLFGNSKRDIETEAQMSVAWEMTTELLAMLRDRSRAIGAPLVIVSLPDHALVDPQRANLKGINMLNVDIQEQLAVVMAELEIPYLELLPGLRTLQSADEAMFYYEIDRHLTPAGNAGVAELALPFIREQLSQAARQ